MVLAGCAQATPTEAPPVATEAPAPVVTEAPPPYEGMSASGDCANGTLIKSVEAVDEFTVKFTMCVPDPAFLSKIAFSPFAIYPKEWLEANTAAGSRLDKPDRHRALHGERMEPRREPDLHQVRRLTGGRRR